jgi:hypothetical protein
MQVPTRDEYDIELEDSILNNSLLTVDEKRNSTKPVQLVGSKTPPTHYIVVTAVTVGAKERN